MKKITRYIISLLLLLIFCNLGVIVKADTISYITWESSTSYLISNDLEGAPITLEATIKLNNGFKDRGGIIFSNYADNCKDTEKGYVIFEIYTNGNPSVTFVDLEGNKISSLFKNVNVATGEFIHLSLVMDGNKNLCYLNGELKEEKSFDVPYEHYISSVKYAVGGDRTSKNTNYFKGQIADVAVYGDARTASEVKSDYSATVIDQSDLLVAYDLTNKVNPDFVEDLSQNDNDLRKFYENDTLITDPESSDFDYSIAVIGDTQNININYYNVRKKYDSLKTTYDKLKTEYYNAYTELAKQPVDLYDELAKEYPTSKEEGSKETDFYAKKYEILEKLYTELKKLYDDLKKEYDDNKLTSKPTEPTKPVGNHMTTLYDYIVENVEDKKIKHVAGMGDITNDDYDFEYEVACEEFKRMDGLVQYSLVRGNHDKEAGFEKFLGVNSNYCDYSSQYKEYYKNSTNTVHEFSAGNLDYLVLVLDFGAGDDVLEWASDVVEAHPYHNVIVSTHGYLDRNGFLIRPSSSGSNVNHGGYNEGVDLWGKFVSQHENIVLVLCGHEPSQEVEILRSKGVHGNTVTQMLIDTQYVDRDDINAGGEGYGIVSMLYFSNGGKTVDFRYYSTIKEQYYKSTNQFRMTIDVVKRKVDQVRDDILNLPSKDNITLLHEEEVYKLNELYLSLTEEEQATIDESKLLDALDKIDTNKAKSFDEMVLSLPDVITFDNQDVLLEMKEIYEKSSEIFKHKIEHKELFEEKLTQLTALINLEKAPIINYEILYLPYPLTLNDKDKVLDLRKRYEELDVAAKEKVTYIEKLEEAEAIIDILSVEYDKALLVDEMIGNLPNDIDLSCEEEIKSVRNAYAKLSSIAKEYVTKLDDLEKAEEAILDAYAKKNAKNLNEMILSLPDNISLADKDIIVTIRNRYEALDEASKKYVQSLFLLESFEARIMILEEMKENVEILNDDVDLLPSDVTDLTLDDKEYVEKLLAKYNSLTDEEKQFFTKADKLNSAVDRIYYLENRFFTPTVVICGSIVLLWILCIGCWIFIQKIKPVKKG